MWKVNEIFHSLQGEGYNTGTASVFIRLSGCNLHCAFCDTRHEEGKMMSLPEIVEQVMRYPKAPLIVLTGGEPSLWIDEDFISGLKQMTGKRIAIETNGTRPLPQRHRLGDPVAKDRLGREWRPACGAHPLRRAKGRLSGPRLGPIQQHHGQLPLPAALLG